jgi:NAD(P)-dependent dehydrogenase (short-subunit alcohol dehydrogenase family)
VAGILAGKVALITGTGGGQGRAAALRFVAEGALVVGCDVNVENARATAALVRAAGGEMTSNEPVDLGDPEQARGWVESAAELHGGIDIVYNNAGTPRFAPIAELTVEDWKSTIHNELDHVFYVTKFAWPYLARTGGVVISTASISGHRGTQVAGGAAHSAAKGGVLAMSRQFAVEGAPLGIRAVTISPGVIRVPGTEAMLEDPRFRDLMLGRNLVPRIGEPDEIAGLAAFLASDAAAYITGADINIDGGATAF